MKKIIFITLFFISTFSFAQDWQQQLNQLSNDMIKIANDARIAKEKRQQEEQQRLEVERQRKEQERLKQEQERQEAIQIFNGKMPEYTDIVNNPNNPEMKYYMDYIVYQAKKAGFEYVDMSTCFSEEEECIARKSLAYFKKGNTNVSIGIGFWLKESAQSFRRILWCYCTENCSSISDIKLPVFLDKSLSTTDGLVLNINSVPKSTPSTFLTSTQYRGFEIESNIDQKESIQAYRHNAQLTKICHSDDNIANKITWYKKAANLGDTLSMLSIAETYEKELKDYLEAIKYYKQYFNKTNDMVTAAYVGRLYASSTVSNNEKAKEWFAKAGLSDDRIGNVYEELNNNNEALYWYKKAANEGNTDMFKKIAFLYENNNTIYINDYTEVQSWFQKAIDNTTDLDEKANLYNFIAELYRNSKLTFPKNYAKAIQFYKKALFNSTDQKYKSTIISIIAKMYSSSSAELLNTGIDQDYEEAKKWYLNAIDLNIDNKQKSTLMWYIYKLYETGGINLEKSKSEAKYWKKKSDSIYYQK